MRTYLVAVSAPSEDAVTKFLLASPLGPGNRTDDGEVEEWWIAEDDRHDGSDNDSAIFVPRGSQSDMAKVISDHCDAMSDVWSETGYPYTDDVSGTWYSEPAGFRLYSCVHCHRPIEEVPGEGYVSIDGSLFCDTYKRHKPNI